MAVPLRPDDDRMSPPAATESVAPVGPARRSDLGDLRPFRTGVPAPQTIRMHANEEAFGPFPETVEVAARAASQANRYPDNDSSELVRALAGHLGLSAAQIIVGPGSITLCLQAAQAYCGPGDEIVFGWPSFEAYPLITRIVGATPVPVALRPDATLDLEAMAAAVTSRTRMVLLCSPNNPTGPVLGAEATQQLVEALPRNVLVVLDEAYVEFVDDPDALDGVALLRSRLTAQANLLVLRTFSKAYGLAGMRIGYGAGPSDVMDSLRCVGLPYAVNGVAQQMALAALGAQAALGQRRDALIAERARVQTHLSDLAYQTPESDANFCWLVLPDSAEAFTQHCANRDILVRGLPGQGVRVTFGTPTDNDRFLVAAAEFGARQ